MNTAGKFQEAQSSGLSRLMLVSGEASGDEHGARLVEELKLLIPGLEVFGMGGSALRGAGMDVVVDTEKSASVMGITEVLGSVRKIFSAFNTLIAEAERRKAEVVVFIDFPDFNMRLARSLKKRGFKTVYYITPQVWAWRSGRVKAIKRDFDLLLPIFPFEAKFFSERGVTAKFVGHPFLDRPAVELNREDFLTTIGADPQRKVLALLPGSRKAELEQIAPPLLEAFSLFVSSPEGSDFQVLLPLAPGVKQSALSALLEQYPPELQQRMFLLPGKSKEVFAVCDLGVVASGTATVEAALSSKPFIAVYKMSRLSYRIAKALVKGVRNFAMPNIVLSRSSVPELLQDELTAENISRELRRLIAEPNYAARLRDDLLEFRQRLQSPLESEALPAPPPRAAARAAHEIIRLV